MQLHKFIGIAMLSAVSAIHASAAHAQGLTRGQVREELIEAQHDGLGYVSDASYPDVSPVYKAQFDARRATRSHDSGFGEPTSGGTQSGTAGSASSAPMQSGNAAPNDTCVGPASFCNVYFGN